MKAFLTTVALAALVASPAFAASSKRTAQTVYAPSPAYSSYASMPALDPFVVDGQYIGTDPDVNVRMQLLRDAGASNAN